MMKPLRICLVSYEYPPAGIGGIAAYVYQLAYGLAEAGHDVSVIAGPASGDKQEIGNESSSLSPPGSSRSVHLYRVDNRRFPLPPPVRRKGGGLWNMLERSWTVDRTIARLEGTQGAFDVVEMPNWGSEALVYSLHPRAPLVIRLSTPLAEFIRLRKHPPPRFGIRLVYFLEALPARRANCIIANSKFIAHCCAELYRIPITKPVLIPHGIPVPPSPPVKRTTDDQTVTILYVGRLERRKGIDRLLQAIPQVICNAPHCKFVIAGADIGAAPQGGSYRDYFAGFATSVARQATTFLGHVEEGTLSRLYAECDVFVSPSPFESFGLTFVEAMIHAKPVVAFRASAVPEVVAHNETGILVELDNIPELANALIRLAADDEMRQEMGKRGHERARAKFTVQRMVEETVSCYRRIIAETKKRYRTV